ncbi:capping protein inhibiting regulator of actin dynamics isoform 2-T2 [Aplochiton taeniatus]
MLPKVLLQWCAALSSCAAEIDRRRQGKFQPFKHLFEKRKKREVDKGFDAGQLKASFSTEEVCNGVVSDDEETNEHLRELNPIGSRALSHDSIFIPEEPAKEPRPEQTMSQENVSDKVRNLQRQIAQGIKFGQKPPSPRKSAGDEGSSDEEEVPRSPLKVFAQVEAEPGETEPKVHGASPIHWDQPVGTHSTPVKSPRARRVPATGTIESINLDSVPQSIPRLDNTAAKHKLSVKPKNQRISRKHRRFTQDLCEVSLSGILQEDLEAAGLSTHTQYMSPGPAEEEEHLEPPDQSKKQRLQDEERQELRRKRELEEQRREEERRKRTEELRLQEIEERMHKQREEERIFKEQEERKRREEGEQRMKEETRIREEEERRRLAEEERMRREEEERRMTEEKEAKKRWLEEQRKKEEDEKQKREDEERRQRELKEERLRLDEEKRLREEREEEERRKKQEEIEKQRLQQRKEQRKKEEEENKKREVEDQKRLSSDEPDGCSDPLERKRRAEEVRWREMEERQRPFTFKVSSGEKQILFQKVNLTPVTLPSGQQGGAVSDQRGISKASSPGGGGDSPTLPSSQYVPHTAILVTGAQLCGTAVNLDQIKDTACKTLLGLGEDKKGMGTPPPTKSKTSPDSKTGKTKSLSESSPLTDQSGAAVLAEWASIRSKIFKGAEERNYEDYPEPSHSQTRPSSEELSQTPFQHSNLRKTMSASAKFSITPARKKFADSNRNSELVSEEDREELKTELVRADTPSAPSPATASKAQSKAGKGVRISAGTEECMFAKDLPSFLVPSSTLGTTKPTMSEADSGSTGESEDSDDREEGGEREEGSGTSPFGIKLRRTNYSLRFHSEQSTEKRKKRYSAGDSFDGVPSPLSPIETDCDSSVFFDTSSPLSPSRDGLDAKPSHSTASPVEPRAKAGRAPRPLTHSEGNKHLSRVQVCQRPTTPPKPTGASPTPPPSPLPRPGRRGHSEPVPQRPGDTADSASQDEQVDRREESSAVAQLQRSMQGEEEPKEKRSFFPSISIPWREKADRKTELIKKEKPSLQSRHSLDSTRAQEKEAGPLWITLALQKQKGFREQQQSRDERRCLREAKVAEKQGRDSVVMVSPSEGKGSGASTPPKAPTPEEPKRPDTLLGRLERRDHLKKANTLPGSVTVEIADSTPSPPAVKEVTKRFPSTDTPQVSTEPAWLALAKRKAKAWSDCPQIIK